MLALASDPSENKKEKLWKSPAVFTYPHPPPPPHPRIAIHLRFLSFPSPRWADPWLAPAEKSWALIIPTERVAKANLAKGNGGPAPFPSLPISSLSFSVSVFVCAAPCSAACRQQWEASPCGDTRLLWVYCRVLPPFW